MFSKGLGRIRQKAVNMGGLQDTKVDKKWRWHFQVSKQKTSSEIQVVCSWFQFSLLWGPALMPLKFYNPLLLHLTICTINLLPSINGQNSYMFQTIWKKWCTDQNKNFIQSPFIRLLHKCLCLHSFAISPLLTFWLIISSVSVRKLLGIILMCSVQCRK